jgi:hypothetical protein
MAGTALSAAIRQFVVPTPNCSGMTVLMFLLTGEKMKRFNEGSFHWIF